MSSKRSAPPGDGDKQREKNPRINLSDEDDTLSEAELKRIMSETFAAQFPRLILETSKVVTEQLAEQNESRSFVSFSQEMRLIRQKQAELTTETKAAAIKSEGEIQSRAKFLKKKKKIYNRVSTRGRSQSRNRSRSQASCPLISQPLLYMHTKN